MLFLPLQKEMKLLMEEGEIERLFRICCFQLESGNYAFRRYMIYYKKQGWRWFVKGNGNYICSHTGNQKSFDSAIRCFQEIIDHEKIIQKALKTSRGAMHLQSIIWESHKLPKIEKPKKSKRGKK